MFIAALTLISYEDETSTFVLFNEIMKPTIAIMERANNVEVF